MKKTNLILLVFVLSLILFLGYSLLKNKKTNTSSSSSSSSFVSSRILDITFPVTLITGKVQKIEGDTMEIVLENRIGMMPVPPDLLNKQPSPTVVKEQIIYKVKITDKTKITEPVFMGIKEKIYAKKDIKTGSIVTIYSLVDLRTLEGDTFEAQTIMLPSSVKPEDMIKNISPPPLPSVPEAVKVSPVLSPIPPKETVKP